MMFQLSGFYGMSPRTVGFGTLWYTLYPQHSKSLIPGAKNPLPKPQLDGRNLQPTLHTKF